MKILSEDRQLQSPTKLSEGKPKGKWEKLSTGRQWRQGDSLEMRGPDSGLGYVQNNRDEIADGGVKGQGNQQGEHEGSMHWRT